MMSASAPHVAVVGSSSARRRHHNRGRAQSAGRGDGKGPTEPGVLRATRLAVARSSDDSGSARRTSSEEHALVGRRALTIGGLAAAAAAVVAPPAAEAAVKWTPGGLDPERRFFQTFPPIWRELVPGAVWGLEQEQALDVLAMNIRTTVVKLKSGDLVVFSPQAPTEEFFALLDELGPVKHIVLPTYALEHKVYIPAMSRRYPAAKVWVAPGTWSVPVDLPLSWLGINAAGTLDGSGGEGDEPPPWLDEIECKILRVDTAGANPYIEAVFLHVATRSLLVTDLVLSIPVEPPAVISRDRLLNLAPDDPADAPAPPSEEALRIGWAKASLVVSFLGPSRQEQVEGGKLKWEPGYEKSFAAISDRLIPSPILRTLVFSKGRGPTRRFVDEVCRDWGGEGESPGGGGEGGGEGEGAGENARGFDKIIAAHYDAPVEATAADLRRAFAFLDNPGPDGLGLGASGAELPEEDMGVLLQVNDVLEKIGLGKGTE